MQAPEKAIKKIVIIGSESTGKSTIAAALAGHFDTAFVPEFARTYLEQLNRDYVYEDLLAIAKGQLIEEEKAISKAKNGFLFYDTDLYVLKVWSEHKYNKCDEWILRQIATRNYDFYFLTDIDLPWEADPQREHPQPEMRQYFFKIYQHLVLNTGKPWIHLSGNKEQRLRTAIEALQKIF